MSTKEFRKNFGIKSSIVEEQIKFVNRIEITIFDSIYSNFITSDYSHFFKQVCYEMGIKSDYYKLNTLSGHRYSNFKKIVDGKFLTCLEMIVAIYNATTDTELSSAISKYVNDSLGKCSCSIGITWHNGMFYPEGAELLDAKLVNDNLDWLTDFPNVYSPFKDALQHIGMKGKERFVVDNLRLSLELLLKEKLKNSKSIEKQKDEIGKYLKEKNTSSEISNLFWQALDYYSKYQNNNAKHNDTVNPDEVEFILYLTGTLMRFILTQK